MFKLNDIRKLAEGIRFDEKLSLERALQERNPDILALTDVNAKGTVSYDQGLYLLNYQLTYTITLPSSRSMEAVTQSHTLLVNEVFIEKNQIEDKKELVEDNLVLILEEAVIDLNESVLDNILLNIPLKILTEKEEQEDLLPAGHDWAVLSEEQYQQLQEDKKKENSPFAALSGLFDDE